MVDGSMKPLKPAQVKEMVRQDWTTAAGAWRKWHPKLAAQMRPITEALVRAAGVRPGMRILDLACGSGDPALTLARVVGSGGHVTATDLVPEMLQVAEENARTLNLGNISFRQADAEALPFANRSFDAVTCRFGVMFFPDVDRALAEMRRVLRPGGRVALMAWGPMEQNPLFTATVGIAMKHAQLPPPAPGAPHPFNFGPPGSLATALKHGGFADVREETLSLVGRWGGSPEECWEMTRDIAAPFRKAGEAVPAERRQAMVADILAAIGRYYDGRQVNLPTVVNLGTGNH